MLKLIAILVLSGNLSVAVETDAGYVEKTFPNTAAGAEKLVGYAEKAVGNPEDGVHVVVGWLKDDDNDRFIRDKLASAGVKHALTTPEDITAAAKKNHLPESSPVAVALAFKERFAFLFRKKAR